MGLLGKSFGGIFKPPKHKKFNYTPMYYDEDAERLEHRKAMIEREVEREKQLEAEGKKNPQESIRESMELNWSRNYRRKTIVQSNFRLVIIVLILVVAAWFYLMSV